MQELGAVGKGGGQWACHPPSEGRWRGWLSLLVQVSSGASWQGLCVLKPLPLFRPQFPYLCKEGLGCNDVLNSHKELS